MNVPHRAFAVAAALWAVLSPWLIDTREIAFGLAMRGFDPATVETWATLIVAAGLPLVAYLALFIAAPPVARWVASSPEPR